MRSREFSRRFLAAALLVAATTGASAQDAIVYPDPSLTPGSIRTTDVAMICGTGTSQFRHWDRERSDLIFARYGIAPADRIQYTLDHLVPLEIGGADTIDNIWPEPRRSLAGEWDDTRKDELERRLESLGMQRRARRARGAARDRRGLDRGLPALRARGIGSLPKFSRNF